MRYWILIADASRARLYSTTARNAPLKLEEAFDYVPGREKASDIESDEPGRYSRAGKGGILSAMEPGTPVHKVEERRFAAKLAEMLHKGLLAKSYDGVALFAAPEFLGFLRQSLDDQVRKHLLVSIPKDLTQMDERELPKELSPVFSGHPD